MIRATKGKLHWNYFIALERDLELASRYVEFCEKNFDVYSIELAHLLFAAASEVDVIAKLLCTRIKPAMRAKNIDQYRKVLLAQFPYLPKSQVFVDRYGLTLEPWDNWALGTNPVWWRSYNDVKHERDAYFNKATLKNALNALGALLILMHYHYSYELAPHNMMRQFPLETTRELQPEATLLRFEGDYNYKYSISVAKGVSGGKS
jgi:hypothetical protein